MARRPWESVVAEVDDQAGRGAQSDHAEVHSVLEPGGPREHILKAAGAHKLDDLGVPGVIRRGPVYVAGADGWVRSASNAFCIRMRTT